MSLRLTLIQKGDLYPSRLLPLMTEFSVFMLLQDIAPESNWLEGVSLNFYKLTWKINVRIMKTKLYVEIKWIVEKRKRPYRYCSNYALPKPIVGNGLEDLWRRENPESSEFSCYDKSSDTNSRIDRSMLI